MLRQDPGDFTHVVAAAETQQARTQQVHPGAAALLPPAGRGGFGAARRRQLGLQQGAHQLIEGFGGAPVLLLGIGGQLQAHHRHPQIHAPRQGAGLVLDQLGRAALPHQQGFGLETIHRRLDRGLHQLGRVAPQIPGLEGGVGDRRAPIPPLDHGEQQIGVGVPLGRMQHVVHPFHRGGDPHRSHVGGAFIGPQGQFHGVAVRRKEEREGRKRGAAGRSWRVWPMGVPDRRRRVSPPLPRRNAGPNGAAGAGRTVRPALRPDRSHGSG